MRSLKLSVLIITRNRAGDLVECLDALVKQTKKPFEIVIVDNNSKDDTAKKIKLYSKLLPIKYIFLKKTGISISRNTAVNKAQGDIVCFTDDDCVPPADWLKSIEDHFIKYDSDVVMGCGLNFYPNNLYAIIEQFNYETWLKNAIQNLNVKTKISDGKIIDTKITSFKKKVFRKVSFSENLQQDEDLELGTQLMRTGAKILYDPKIKTYHKNSNTCRFLIHRNFYRGVSQHKLRLEKGIEIKLIFNNKVFHKISTKKALYYTLKKKFGLPIIISKILINIYRSTYLLGKTIAALNYKFTNKHIRIPNR